MRTEYRVLARWGPGEDFILAGDSCYQTIIGASGIAKRLEGSVFEVMIQRRTVSEWEDME